MSTTLQQIRSIIQDLPVLVQETLTFDGTQTAIRLSYFPVVATSVEMTPDPTTVDEQSGLLEFASAPTAGSVTVTYSFVSLLDSTLQDLLDVQTAVDDEADSSEVLRLTAALALDAMATSMTIILKRIDLLDLKTDGPAVAKSLREHAKSIRDLMLDPKYAAPAFDIAEQVTNIPGYDEKVLKDFMRSGG